MCDRLGEILPRECLAVPHGISDKIGLKPPSQGVNRQEIRTRLSPIGNNIQKKSIFFQKSVDLVFVLDNTRLSSMRQSLQVALWN